jgi:hypothetical protein
VLRAGQVWEIPNDGLVLMEAVGYGRVRLHGPAAPAGSGWPRKEQPAKVQMPSGRPCLP